MPPKELIVIVCFRARGKQTFRQQQLDYFIPYMHAYLNKQDLKHQLLVFEQNDDEPFNRGAIFNVGYLEAKKYATPGYDTYYSHHNCDVIPLTFDYTNFTRGTFKDIYGWPGGLGAAYLFDGPAYERTNGYPNNLWGWGGDDTAIMLRAEKCNIPIDRSCYNTPDVKELDKELNPTINGNNTSNDTNRNFVLNVDQHRDYWQRNGLNTIRYTMQTKAIQPELNYSHFLVNLHVQERRP